MDGYFMLFVSKSPQLRGAGLECKPQTSSTVLRHPEKGAGKRCSERVQACLQWTLLDVHAVAALLFFFFLNVHLQGTECECPEVIMCR